MERGIFHRTSSAVWEWFRDQIFTRKMASPLGIFVLSIIAVGMAYTTVLINYKLSIGITFLAAALLLCILSVIYPVVGYCICFILPFFMMLPNQMSNGTAMVPTGLFPEYYSYLTLLGLLTHKRYRKEVTASFWSTPIMISSIVMLAFLLLEFFNPNMFSKLGWFNFVRKQFSYTLFILISYIFFNSREAIKFFVRFWIFIATVHVLYCLKQEYIGFFDFEYIWLISDEKRFALYVNDGMFRKWGLLSDPATAGILYACSTVLLVILGLRATKTYKRALYLMMAVVHFLATSYTGTRTATLMVIAGMAFYCVLTLYEKRTLIFSGFFGILILALLFAPIHDNVVINRLRSTFEGSKDPSAMARDINRRTVQPYVWSHPIGGGLNTCGQVGQLYNPGHYLSMIPPDSAYMQTMMEQGPIGLAILLIFYYVTLRTGIKYFYRVKDPHIQTLYVANLVAIFTMQVAQFSQQAIGQYPGVLYYYAALALMMKLHQFDSPGKKAVTES
jgi:putative inorganic carbon (HCO3(-)) transporter